MNKKRSRCLALGLVLILGLFLTQAQAADKPKDYPTKPVTIQVGFGAGGSSDVGVRHPGRGPQEGHRSAGPWRRTKRVPAAR